MKFCAPAIIYVIFSLCQIIIDLFTGLYNTAVMKLVVAILITFLLNGLCQNGLSVISWIIVFIPFILMTFIVAMLLYIFGLKATTGTIQQSTTTEQQQQQENKNATSTTFQWLPPSGSTSPEYQS